VCHPAVAGYRAGSDQDRPSPSKSGPVVVRCQALGWSGLPRQQTPRDEVDCHEWDSGRSRLRAVDAPQGRRLGQRRARVDRPRRLGGLPRHPGTRSRTPGRPTAGCVCTRRWGACPQPNTSSGRSTWARASAGSSEGVPLTARTASPYAAAPTPLPPARTTSQAVSHGGTGQARRGCCRRSIRATTPRSLGASVTGSKRVRPTGPSAIAARRRSFGPHGVYAGPLPAAASGALRRAATACRRQRSRPYRPELPAGRAQGCSQQHHPAIFVQGRLASPCAPLDQ
jgi:hypothetical protein